MPEPVATTLTASAIASLAFQEFIKSGAGELAKKFTAEAIAKMEDLRKLLCSRLRGKHAVAEEALQKAETGVLQDSIILQICIDCGSVMMKQNISTKRLFL